jgi:hypothetical protein
LRWKVEVRAGKTKSIVRVRAGDAAGTRSAKGYFSVQLNQKIYKVHRVIWELLNGSIDDEFQIDHVNGIKSDNSLSNLRVVANVGNSRNRTIRKTNISGVNGVSRCSNGYGNFYWKAHWVSAEGRSKSKTFSILKYGNDEAFKLACDYRAKMIEQLNANGAGYTERHGKE